MSNDSVILKVSGVKKSFGGVEALRGVDFSVKRGSVTSLIGPNGAGKTTMFNVITGFYPADAGTIVYDNQHLEGLPSHQIVHRGVTRTFQMTRVIERLSVLDNLMVSCPNNPGDKLWNVFGRPGAVRRREAEIRDKAMDLLKFISLDRLAHDFAGTLSGGQRKLVEFGRALMADPVLVLMDEPMAGVNRTLGWELLEHVRELREKSGLTFLIVEHDMDVVMTISDTVVVMDQGRTLSVGTASEVRKDPRVIEAYLGTTAPATSSAGEDLHSGE